MNSTHSPNSMGLSQDGMLWLGILTMATPGYHDIPMTEAIKKLISTPELNLTALLGDTFKAAAGGTGDPRAALLAIDEYLDTLPHNSSATLVHTIEVVFTILATIFLVLRFIGRKAITGKIRMDDWTMFFAWTLTAAFLATILRATVSGYHCHHIWDSTYNRWRRSYLFTFISEILFSFANVIIKLSWLLFYWTLTPTPWFRNSILVLGVFSVLTTLAASVMLLFACKHIAFWDDPLNAKCSNQVTNFRVLIHGPLSIVQDLLILLLPIPVVVYNLKLTTREKIVVIAMFAFGSFACIAGFVRVVYSKRFVNEPDLPYRASFAGLLAVIELDLAIAISSVPAIRGLCRRYLRPNSPSTRAVLPKFVQPNEQPTIELANVPASAAAPAPPKQDATINIHIHLPPPSVPPRHTSTTSAMFIESATAVTMTLVKTTEISVVQSNSPSTPTNRRSSDWDRDFEQGTLSAASSESVSSST